MKYGWGGEWPEPTLGDEAQEPVRGTAKAPPRRKRQERKLNWTVSHVCPEFAAVNDMPHDEQFYHWGAAIDETMNYEAISGRWWIANGEYASPLRFCPFCGIELATLVPTEGRGLGLVERRAG